MFKKRTDNENISDSEKERIKWWKKAERKKIERRAVIYEKRRAVIYE